MSSPFRTVKYTLSGHYRRLRGRSRASPLWLIPVAALVIVLASFLFAVLLVLFLGVAAAVGLRLWWLRRKLRRSGGASRVIEGDYLIIEEHRRSTRRRDEG